MLLPMSAPSAQKQLPTQACFPLAFLPTGPASSNWAGSPLLQHARHRGPALYCLRVLASLTRHRERGVAPYHACETGQTRVCDVCMEGAALRLAGRAGALLPGKGGGGKDCGQVRDRCVSRAAGHSLNFTDLNYRE